MGYPKHIYDKAWQELSRRKHQAKLQAQHQREDAYTRIPQLQTLEREIARTASYVAKAVVSDPDNAEALVQGLARDNLALQEKRSHLLAQNGLPADYLDEKHSCPHCRDQGYIENRMCTCLSQLLEKQAYAQLSRVSPAQRCTFESFVLNYYSDKAMEDSGIIPRQEMQRVVTFCRRYAQNFSPTSESLLFLGNTGLGKTHMSLAIAGAVIQAGYGVIYSPVQKLLDTLESEKFSRSSEAKESYSENTRITLECDLLVLDDLGTEFSTGFSASVLYNIINTRLIESRPTIISTNLRMRELEERYTQRMVSRLVCGYQVMEFLGKDIRMIKRAMGQ